MAWESPSIPGRPTITIGWRPSKVATKARRSSPTIWKAIAAQLGSEQTAAIDAEAKAWFDNHHFALQFVNKDGAKWKEYPTYAVVKPTTA